MPAPSVEDRLTEEERIRALQFEQIPLEGGKPKGRVSLFSATVVTAMAMILPLRLRTALGFALNFLFNDVRASILMLFGWISQRITVVAVFFVYIFVVGPTALVARLLGHDPLRLRPHQGSMWTDKDPADAAPERFERQF